MRSRRLCVGAPTAAPAVCAACRSSNTRQLTVVGFMQGGNYPCGVIDHLYAEVLLRCEGATS